MRTPIKSQCSSNSHSSLISQIIKNTKGTKIKKEPNKIKQSKRTIIYTKKKRKKESVLLIKLKEM